VFAVRRLGELLRTGALDRIVAVPCAVSVEQEARRLGIPLTTLEEHPAVDLTIDGADEVDSDLNLIKGGGGALLREKIVAQASRREVIVVDESKMSPVLGARWAVPVEVVPFGWRAQALYLESLGAAVTQRHTPDGRVFTTDQGNFILEARLGPIADPAALAAKLAGRAGIVEHGLFLGIASEVIIAGRDGLRILTR
jgi:ribose 5-phosphate isomerase A